MRRPAPVSPPVCLTIAGSDSGGGAGIQADLKTMEAVGTFATSAITAVTAQNTRGVTSTHILPEDEVAAQIRAVRDDFTVDAAKTGMLGTAAIVETVREELSGTSFPVVVDPVMVAASGDRLLDADAEEAYVPLISEATLVTPNADEATVLTGIKITNENDQVAAGEGICDLGADAALIKGGHVDDDPVKDVLVSGDAVRTYEHPRVESTATHGSGCTLASAIAAFLARDESLDGAVEAALAHMERAVRYPVDVGTGPGSVHHLATLRNEAEKPATIDAVREIVGTLVNVNVGVLIPEVGMNVVASTPYAESRTDTAAVEGRISRTEWGAWPTSGVAIGASSHVARFLLAVRELDPAVRFAINCRNDDRVRTAIDELGWPTGEYDRADQPRAVREQEGSTMGWGARKAIEGADERPVAIFDPGAHGKEPMTKLLATDASELTDLTIALARAVAD